MMLLGPITTDFNTDHLIKVAPAYFFPLISMCLIRMYFENNCWELWRVLQANKLAMEAGRR